MTLTRLLALIARRTARVWLTKPLRAADAWTLIRHGDVQVTVIRQRPPREDS